MLPMDLSECAARPARILLRDPRHGAALAAMTAARLAEANFLALPDPVALHAEYAAFAAAIAAHVPVTYLSDLVGDDPDYRREAADNPNLMFLRDAAVTLPWAPDEYIPARFALPDRVGEPAVIGRALEKLGLRPLLRFADDEFLEGGDVLPAMDAGQRILIIGFGVRTSKAAAIRLAIELIPAHVDQIIGLSHDPALLHLDTGFTILPNRVMFAAAGMFHSGFVIDRNRAISAVDPIARAQAMGFTIVRCAKADAIAHERCNLLPLGEGAYLAFAMPDDLRRELEARAGITITSVAGDEIAKATGGVHCLTRPVYR
ncbi:arginine deiminase family protein [uncultured Sphingomonas sp.]|uniref:arginine deiminase family protein n=1 Tax=uncultured Sphingomonas sp. TaxID=158754 RepID=UPI0035CC74D6